MRLHLHLRSAISQRGSRAFTLIELLVVIVILAILMAIAIPAYLSQQKKAQEAKAQTYLAYAYRAIRSNTVDTNNQFPSAVSMASWVQESEPELQVETGSCYSDSLTTDDVVIDTHSTSSELVMCSKSTDGTVWQQAATLTVSSSPISLSDAITFAGTRTGQYQIYTMAADGSGEIQLTSDPAFANGAPRFSPDGTKIVFNRHAVGLNNQIYVMNADGSNLTRLTSDSSNDAVPIYSLDGSKIFFVTDRDGNQEIYSMNPDGSDQTDISNNSALDGGVHPCPDGTTLVYRNDRSGTAAIWKMDLDGSGQQAILSDSYTNSAPSCGPGDKIVFNSNRSGTVQIWSMNEDGSGLTQLTSSGTNDNPMWSPDGSKIAYYSNRSGAWEIYTMNPDGTDQTQLTHDGKIDQTPSWR